MPSAKGPRQLVLRNVKSKAGTDNNLRDAVDPNIRAGDVGIHSSSMPGLELGATYTARFQQEINLPVAPSSDTLYSQKSFTVTGNPYALEPSLVHSVYPPSGHADYWNTLPHVLFTKPQVPWAFPADDSDKTMPWLALLVFTEPELTMPEDQASIMASSIGRTPDRTATLAYKLWPKDLVAMNAAFTQPLPVTAAADPTPLQAMVVQASLFAGLFAKYDTTSSAPLSGVSRPDLQRYAFMSHVRKMAAVDGGGALASYSATVAPRTGPLDISTPTTAYAHLVSLAGVAKNMAFDPAKPAALISLYSWTFTYLPPTSFAVKKSMESLGRSIQPMRNPDASVVRAAKMRDAAAVDDWVKSRMLAGYSLIKYRTPTGEPTIGLHRAILTPVKFDPVDFPPSDFGADLAIVDERSGYLDLTFQLAWELGRSAVMADRTLSAALTRLRRDLHCQSLAATKQSLDQTFETASNMIKSLGTTVPGLDALSHAAQTRFALRRYQAPAPRVSRQGALSFASPTVQAAYRAMVEAATAFAQAVPSDQLSAIPGPGVQSEGNGRSIYDETNAPASSDYAAVLGWIMDRWFLAGIPTVNLISDPAFIPKESIRSFYVDQSWFKVFVDGVLSVAEHFDEGDSVRESIKARLSTFLTTKRSDTGFPPQVPRWGIFVRSELVTKFPDLRILAPWSRADAAKEGKLAPILRTQTMDVDLLCVLFDREPADFDPEQGISLQPPEHQLTSMFGGVEGIQDGIITIPVKEVFVDAAKSHDPSSYGSGKAPLRLQIHNPLNQAFDGDTRSLCPAGFARLLALDADAPSTPALVASQLMVTGPGLLIRPSHLLSAPPSSSPPSPASLSTSRPRPKRTPSIAPPTAPLIQAPEPLGAATVSLSPYPPPLTPVIAAMAKTDLSSATDQSVIQAVFPSLIKAHPLRPNDQDSSAARSFISTTLYNLKAQRPTEALPVYGLAGVFPKFLDITSDLHVMMLSVTGYGDHPLLTSVDVAFPVGKTELDLIAPAEPVSGPSLPVPNAYGDYPARPRHSVQALQTEVLPGLRVRPVGAHSRRWRILTDLTPSTLTVTLVPNTSQGFWDISQVSDMSFVVENVRLNVQDAWAGWANIGPGTMAVPSTVRVTEHYRSEAVGTVGRVDTMTLFFDALVESPVYR